MNPDFSLLLVVLTALSGLIWLVDNLFFRRRDYTERLLERMVELGGVKPCGRAEPAGAC